MDVKNSNSEKPAICIIWIGVKIVFFVGNKIKYAIKDFL